ncbi:two component transcriptional regulator, LytTR family [Dethiosulfatibacter aminovorans DSM 17477]|uniref:Two component transcriptional regulator, LytTR family n=1 Tax=Dethiosulfatibacter aminovorans DSM 17477 TaxID=1121476 RepID=A0A1M6E9Z5_9FIRM|nr:LytTR family DNA-binding domain-containing protein [Dethiosulfatibacter aminovorans]SHI82296.1 two component transcriptional regulator, LytTR family [Dethiosulfatibacter aminovorans DSM 17477]
MNCLIIDDEKPSREELRYFIENHSSIEIAGEFENSIQALKFLQDSRDIDVIFLDINMPNLDGMELARIIHRFEVRPELVFVTAYRDYALDAFQVEAFDYLLKPYSRERITGLLNKLEERVGKARSAGEVKSARKPEEVKASDDGGKTRKLSFTNGEKILVLNFDEISCIKANERKVEVSYGDGESFTANYKISELEDKLDDEIFFKSHRSYIVNVEKIKEIEMWFNNTYMLTIEGMDEKIPVSRSYVKEFKKLMKI